MNLSDLIILFYEGKYAEVLDYIDKIDIIELNEEKINFLMLKIEILSDQERFDEAEKFVNNLLEEKYLQIIQKVNLLLTKSKFIFHKGEVKESEVIFTEAEKIFIELASTLKDEFKTEITLLRRKARYQQFNGKLKEAEINYKKSLDFSLEINDKMQQSHSLNSLGSYYLDLANLDEAEKLFKSAFKIRKEFGNKYLINTSLNNIGLIHQTRGELDEAAQYFDQALELTNELDLPESRSNILNNFGLMYQSKGDIEKALQYHNRSLEINQRLGNKASLSISYNNIGLIYLMQGDLNKALDYQRKSLNFGKNLFDESRLAGSYNNIGIIYSQKGELDKALENHFKHLAVAEKFQIKPDMATGYVNIGQIYLIQGKYEQANDFVLKCLAIDREIGNEIDISESLYQMVILEIDRNNLEKSTDYLFELEEIKNKTDNKIIDLRFNIANAVYNKNNSRIIERAKAQQILTDIANDDIIDHELTIFAKLNLCELLLFELKILKNEKVLEEIKQIVDDLLKISKDQHSFKLLIESYLLSSKIAQVELNIPLAFDLLNKAQELALQKGLTSLSIQISNQYDILLLDQENLQKLKEGDATIAEMLEKIEMDKLVSTLLSKQPEDADLEPEQPAYFLILSSGGVTLYNKQFDKKSKLKNELIGGLLTAIHTLSEDIFSTSTSLQRIKHNQYTVIMKPVDDLLFSYVFTGASYNALNKLEVFIQIIKKSQIIWEALQRKIPHLTKSEKDGLELLVKDIF